MKKTLVALSLAAMTLPALAQDKKAPEPDYTITGNAGIFSDYRFRGISQTRLAPAFQGGFDYAHKSGFYAGNWNSSVSSHQFQAGSGLEMDFYAGFKKEIAGIGFDLGTIYYYYPGAEITNAGTKLGKYNNHEVYVGLAYGPVSFKTSYAISNYFGLKGTNDDFLGATNLANSTDSKGTIYYDLSFSKEIAEKITLVAHYGKTAYSSYKQLDYDDYKIGVNIDVNGWILGLAYINNSGLTTTGKTFTTNSADTGADPLPEKKLYKSGGVISLTKTF
jgi:uncharacterized protein (TIGR02001 family)